MIYILIATFILIADILTKIAAERFLIPIRTFPIINNILHFTYVENRGIAFGMFSGGRVVFIIISVLVLAMLLTILIKTKKSMQTLWIKAGTALVVSGAIGNLIERIFKGYVVDFIDFRIINFPVFNVADIAVCVGAGMLLIHFLLAEKRLGMKNEKTETEDIDSE